MLTANGLRQRSEVLQAIRAFFFANGYIEVDTPVRLPVLLPESHLIPFTGHGWFLQTSPELCMKRLLARGCTRIFQICHCFRQEESGRLHQPEFNMLEWYQRGENYEYLMGQCEALLCHLHRTLPHLPGFASPGFLCWNNCRISLTPPWERLTVAEAFRRYADVEVDWALARGLFDEILVTRIEGHLGRDRPVFLCDYPIELGSLARGCRDNPTVAERFELYVAGVELANGFSELVDVEEQRQRFAGEIEKLRMEGREAVMPEAFMADLEKIGAAAGIALGLDRLVMLLLRSPSISEAIPFIFEELQ
ncbi:EF-P lysine aminoacylase EpmA [Desulfobulbus alkaliphilus]|uniref:EF-P lysine aminoacylase EpmA n=1 Tax=Desulfobulbus alkaliphilus TaxID=869814 RepID=UPI001964911E|nr:EF-P lysine aminoacylase EpmA [Desulfobulbus alkaliphilus]MBM9537242.1 EF-P lysine aminoacylase GenX [Desulfobulbus alkaliphilus]